MAMAMTTPLVGGGGGEGGEGESTCCSDPCGYCQRWFCANPMDNCFFLGIVAGGVITCVGAFLMFPPFVIALLGCFTVMFASNRIWALRHLAAEIDRFAVENERLEETQQRLEGEVNYLGEKKDELTKHVTKLEGVVGELTNVSEGLSNELDQFKTLKGNIEKFASETGADVRKILGEANKIHSKMERMTKENERALIGKIAQDIEFLDKDSGMSKEEFDNFFSRIPAKLQTRFRTLGLTFEKVAGEDGVVDFMEVEDLISKLMTETTAEIDSIKV